MAATMLHSSPEKSIGSAKKSNRSLISRSRPIENFPPSNLQSNVHGGLLNAPPPSLSFSYPPSVSFPYAKQIQQPPLLPLPNPNSRSRGLSCPPINRKISNRTRNHQSLAPKKSKPSVSNPKAVDAKGEVKSGFVIVGSTKRLGPDPKDLPKDVSRVLSSSPPSSPLNISDFEKFSGSLFTLSPPPSSLPLPTFSLRPKLSCNAEMAGIDTGATDNLRRLLRLR